MTLALDPSGVHMVVRVRDSEGAEFLLWTNANTTEGFAESARRALAGLPQTSGASLAGLDLPIVESVEIELNMGLNGKLTVNVAAPYDLGLRVMDSSLFKIGNVIEAQIGYPRSGRFTPWFSAIAAKPALRISAEDGLVATFNGEGGAFAALRSASTRSYEATSYRQIMQNIATRHGWTTVFPDPEENSAFDRNREVVSQAGFSDWGFVNLLARQANVDLLLNPDPVVVGRTRLTVRRRTESYGSQPARTYVMRRQIDMINVFPILDLETDGIGIWMPRAASSVRFADIDALDREILREAASVATADVPSHNEMTATGDGAQLIGDHRSQIFAEERNALDAGEFMTLSSRDPGRQPAEVAQAHRDESALRGGINMTITTFGVPEQIPTELIAVRGAGRLDGIFQVQGMVHRAQPGEWTMTMTCLNNAVQSDIIAGLLHREPESTNREEPPEATSDDAGGGGTDVDPEEAVVT